MGRNRRRILLRALGVMQITRPPWEDNRDTRGRTHIREEITKKCGKWVTRWLMKSENSLFMYVSWNIFFILSASLSFFIHIYVLALLTAKKHEIVDSWMCLGLLDFKIYRFWVSGDLTIRSLGRHWEIVPSSRPIPIGLKVCRSRRFSISCGHHKQVDHLLSASQSIQF